MEQLFNIDGIDYQFTSEEDLKISFEKQSETECISLYRLQMDFGRSVCPKPVTLYYRIPCRNMYGIWDPRTRTRYLPFGLSQKQVTESRLAYGMPLKGLYSKDGLNSYLLSLSDVKTAMTLNMGASERTGEIHIQVVFFPKASGPFTVYETLLRADRRPLPFDEAILDTRAWFDSLGYHTAPSPALTKLPMYSTWYSLWQTVTAREVLRECREAVKYGMKTVIIDDGWQTDKAGQIYAYCGDWQPSYRKFRDMRGLVEKLHGMGLSVMLWFSVPFVGYKAKRHAEFAGMYLHDLDSCRCSVLDPRFPKVRTFLTETYVKAVKEWDLDGLKLDFIDRFVTNGEVKEGMDFVSVEDATERLLLEVTEALRAIKPDMMIEFRQPYFGPVIGAYGNMIRVWDCPLDGGTNQIQTLNLRLISGNCAVHSDMIYWHPDDTPEGVAVQLLGTLFSVPQISARFGESTKEQKEVLKHYLAFWNDHRDTLMEGKLSVRFASSGYGYASSVLGGEKISLAVDRNTFEMEETLTAGYLFNLTDEKEILLKTAKGTSLFYDVFDCRGKRLTRKRRVKAPLSEISVPLGGMLKVSR